MLNRLITASVRWRYLVIALCAGIALLGKFAYHSLILDALPDISDAQVIVQASYPGRTPEQMERQVTYPLASALASTSGAIAVRGISMYGESFIYIVFPSSDAMAQARTRVLERLSQVQRQMPSGVVVSLGPDATGVGWVYQYALVDESGTHSPADLRALQDYYLKPELQSLSGVAEVATVGGQERAFYIEVDPRKVSSYNIPLQQVADAVVAANRSGGGGVVEVGNRRVIVSADNRLSGVDDIAAVPLGGETRLRVQDVATVREGVAIQASITDLDGKGQATGGIVIMRQGESAMRVAQAALEKIQALEGSLPAGVKVITVYDRSKLIGRAVSGLQDRLIEEAIAVFIVSLLLLWSWRSAVSAVLVLPVGIFCAGLVFYLQKLEINIMSLGGIAIAVAAMMDASVVMVEHVNQRLSVQKNTREQVLDIIAKACVEVGPALFISLLLITLSFLPVLMLGGREGKLFSPLAWTKTWTMAIACLLSVTLTPALLAIFMRQAQSEDNHRFVRFCQNIYRYSLDWSIQHASKILKIGGIMLISSVFPIWKTGGEFMPPLDEGDFLYMPVTLPSLSSREATKLLQETDAIIKSIPEVDHVFGKAGRAGTATDPAPLSMFETVVTLKPRAEWREGESTESLLATLQQKLQIPGLLSSWGYPIRTRIGMLSTGVKTPLGLKITGTSWVSTEQLAAEIATRLSAMPEIRSAVSSRSDEGMYLDIQLRREYATALGVTARDIEQFSGLIAGSEPIDYLITDKTERYGVTLRLRPDLREDLDAIRRLPVATATGSVPLDSVATISLRKGPAEIRSEGGRPVAYVYIEVKGITEKNFVTIAQEKLQSLALPAGTTLEWVGEYRDFEEAKTRLLLIAPLVLVVVLLLLYYIFKELRRVFLIVLSLPFSLIGGLWLVYLLDFHFSMAVAVGFIALAGLAVEFGVIMVLYLDSTVDEYRHNQGIHTEADWIAAVKDGAVRRLRPKLMTVAIIVASLLTMFTSNSAGSDIMQHIAAPMLGGMITAPLLSMVLIPVLYHRLFRTTV